MSFIPATDAELTRDWTEVKPEDQIVIEKDSHVLSGRVDAITEDGSILWLQINGGGGRRLFTRPDGWLVCREHENE